jgi:hypothetical protein
VRWLLSLVAGRWLFALFGAASGKACLRRLVLQTSILARGYLGAKCMVANVRVRLSEAHTSQFAKRVASVYVHASKHGWILRRVVEVSETLSFVLPGSFGSRTKHFF